MLETGNRKQLLVIHSNTKSFTSCHDAQLEAYEAFVNYAPCLSIASNAL